MPQPNPSQVHIDQALSNVSVAYIQSANGFIADKVFPTVPVASQSDKYFVYTKNDWFRDEAQKRAPATESAGSGFNVGNANYFCDVFAIHKDVDDQTIANAVASPGIDPEADAARFVAQRMMLKREIEWTNTFFTTGVWTGSSTGTDIAGAAWDNYSTSTPIQDVRAEKLAVLGKTGIKPNTLVLGAHVYAALLDHPDFIDRIKYTTDQATTADLLKRLFEVDNLFVSEAVKATNVEGETAAYSFVASKSALLVYSAPAPSLMTPSGGYTFKWNGVSDGAGLEIGTVRIEMPLKRAVRVESQMAWDSKVVAPDVGVFFTAAVS
jgi:hypothetical protein